MQINNTLLNELIHIYTRTRTHTKINICISPKGAGPSAPQIWGVLFYLCVYTLCRRTTKFDMLTYVGDKRISWGQPRFPTQKSGVPVLPNFGVLYTYIL